MWLAYLWNLFEVLLFLSLWIIFLNGLFSVVANFIEQKLPNARNAPFVAGLAVCSVVVFELCRLGTKQMNLQAFHEKMGPPWQCTFYRLWPTEVCQKYHHQGGGLWKLNPVGVIVQLFINGCIVFSRTFGRVFGSALMGFFSELSMFLYVPAIVISLFATIYTIFAFFGYSLEVSGLGWKVHASTGNADQRRSSMARTEYRNPFTKGAAAATSVVREAYQKSSFS